MPSLADLKARARGLKAETYALYLAARHPETPWHAKLFVAAVVAYAFSPIDLIPDFVPVLGYLDDLILIPLGIAVAIRMIPPPVLSECRARSREILANGKPVSRVAGAIIVIIWLTLITLCCVWAYETPYFQALYSALAGWVSQAKMPKNLLEHLLYLPCI